jgi:uncharacterized protein YmfQ (DUF2313 family)
MGLLHAAGVYTLLMANEQKSEAFFVRMGPTEVKLLEQLSEKTGLSRSDVVRQLIRREHAQVVGKKRHIGSTLESFFEELGELEAVKRAAGRRAKTRKKRNL